MAKSETSGQVNTQPGGPVEAIVLGDKKDLGGFSVKRMLPGREVKRVGPFVFFDQMGPADLPPGRGVQVRPHPHIGLSTVTYLFEGEIVHRDSLGYVQPIRPGAVNLMTAGRGIVHSERSDPEIERTGGPLHGLQVWMALPEDMQEIEPAFVHHPRSDLPVIERPGVLTTVIIGAYLGAESPVGVHAETLYLDQKLSAGASVSLDTGAEQQAVFVVSGEVRIGPTAARAGELAVLKPGQVTLDATTDSRLVVIGGEDVGPRVVHWNFVHSSRERIEKARQDWREMKFDLVPGDDEFIPLPD